MNVDQDHQLTGVVIGEAIEVHRLLGPGLDESAYEEALEYRLISRGLDVDRQRGLPLTYKGMRLDCGFRIDLLVQRRLPLELKSVEQLHPIHEAQLLTYLRVGRFPLGLLLNFNVALMKDGLKRMVQSAEWAIIHPEIANKSPNATTDPETAPVVAAAIEVHRNLGPGLLVSAYETAMCYELLQRRQAFQRKVQVPLLVGNSPLPTSAEIPLLVNDQIPVFCMSVATIDRIHTSMLVARLRQGGWKRGLLINFNVKTMLDGVERVSV